ncbi:Uncharacterized protein Nst1_044 [Candidatus Nanobsidianus stetteri]|uniref:Uncharacterized protein n=1 Tax=Nanobsidianus stetteri TaxID=1294122 RepID=R1FUB3_NANST|nr:Uncharacterized protein Nst1_044 [Candidatus Nanobsidianus stetteri]
MDVDGLLDAIVASIFLIIVSLIGIYFPYIVARIFGTHNPYLILEVAGFITYSTSEPGNMTAAFLVTNAPDFFYEFRIIPPIQSSALFIPLYNNNDFLVSIGECYVNNLWQQLADDALNSFLTEVFSYLPGLKNGVITKPLADVLNDVFKSSSQIAKQTAIGAAGMYGLYTYQSTLLQYTSGNYNIWGDIFNALQSSVGPTLWSTVEFTIMQVGDMILDETLPPPADFVAGFAFNLAFTSAITLYQYWQDTSNPYASCYYNQFIQQNTKFLFLSIPNGEYTVYQPYLTLTIYYNPNFTFYNGCNDYYLCDTSFTYIYDPQDNSQDNIFKLDLGNVDNNGNQVFPEFIILSKVGMQSGGPYLNVSILSSTLS